MNHATNVHSARWCARRGLKHNGRSSKPRRVSPLRLTDASLETLRWWLRGRPYQAYPRTFSFQDETPQLWRAFYQG